MNTINPIQIGKISAILLACFATMACVSHNISSRSETEMVLSANQASDDISVYRVDSQDGHLAAVKGSPFHTGAYPVGIAVTPDGRYAYVANQGTDSISGYMIDETGQLIEMASSPFSTGRHPVWVSIEPTGHYMYVANNESDMLTTYIIDHDPGVGIWKALFGEKGGIERSMDMHFGR